MFVNMEVITNFEKFISRSSSEGLNLYSPQEISPTAPLDLTACFQGVASISESKHEETCTNENITRKNSLQDELLGSLNLSTNANVFPQNETGPLLGRSNKNCFVGSKISTEIYNNVQNEDNKLILYSPVSLVSNAIGHNETIDVFSMPLNLSTSVRHSSSININTSVFDRSNVIDYSSKSLSQTYDANHSGKCFLNDKSTAAGVTKPSRSSRDESHMQYLRDNLKVLDEHFTLHRKIGEGSFSSVFLATLKEASLNPKLSKRQYAVKHLIPTMELSRLEQELQCLQDIGGRDNVVGIELCLRSKDNIVFVMPYLPHERFSDYILKLDAYETSLYMKNLMIALKRVHSFQIIHRDVKPSNFLYDRTTKKFLLVDFGLAQCVADVQAAYNKMKSLEKTEQQKRKYSEISDYEGEIQDNKVEKKRALEGQMGSHKSHKPREKNISNEKLHPKLFHQTTNKNFALSNNPRYIPKSHKIVSNDCENKPPANEGTPKRASTTAINLGSKKKSSNKKVRSITNLPDTTSVKKKLFMTNDENSIIQSPPKIASSKVSNMQTPPKTVLTQNSGNFQPIDKLVKKTMRKLNYEGDNCKMYSRVFDKLSPTIFKDHSLKRSHSSQYPVLEKLDSNNQLKIRKESFRPYSRNGKILSNSVSLSSPSPATPTLSSKEIQYSASSPLMQGMTRQSLILRSSKDPKYLRDSSDFNLCSKVPFKKSLSSHSLGTRDVLSSKSGNIEQIKPISRAHLLQNAICKQSPVQFQSLAPEKSENSSTGSSFVRVQNSQVVKSKESDKPKTQIIYSRPAPPLSANLNRSKPRCECVGKPTICKKCSKGKVCRAPRAGTPGFRPPEVLLKYPLQTTAVDLWAAGVILLSILSGCYPFFRSADDLTSLAEIMTIFGTENIQKLALKLGRRVQCSKPKAPLDLRKVCRRLRKSKLKQNDSNGQASVDHKSTSTCQSCEHLIDETGDCLCVRPGKYVPSKDDIFPDAAYDLLERLLDLNPNTRITAAQALDHPFLRDIT